MFGLSLYGILMAGADSVRCINLSGDLFFINYNKVLNISFYDEKIEGLNLNEDVCGFTGIGFEDLCVRWHQGLIANIN